MSHAKIIDGGPQPRRLAVLLLAPVLQYE